MHIFWFTLINKYSKYPSYLIEFEKKIAQKFDSNYALSFSSGTAGFYSIIKTLNLNDKSKVLISEITFPSIIKILQNINCNIEVFKLDKNFQPINNQSFKNHNFDAVIVTHPYGFLSNLNNLKNTLQNKPVIIFDLSHIQCLRINGELLNNQADYSFMSIQGKKAISGGEGGVVFLNNKQNYLTMINLSHPGHPENSKNNIAGYSEDLKLRMHPLASILATYDLKNFDKKNNNLKKKINNIYEILSKLKSISIPDFKNLEMSGFHYGLPFFFKTENDSNNLSYPIIKYNWLTKNDFDKFNDSEVLEDLHFIELDFIKFNSMRLIKLKINEIFKK